MSGQSKDDVFTDGTFQYSLADNFTTNQQVLKDRPKLALLLLSNFTKYP
jgi:hypothetical protein